MLESSEEFVYIYPVDMEFKDTSKTHETRPTILSVETRDDLF